MTADKPRTRTKAHERVIELLSERPAEEVHVLYSPPADASAFREALLARMPKPAPKLVTVADRSARSSGRTSARARTAPSWSGRVGT